MRVVRSSRCPVRSIIHEIFIHVCRKMRTRLIGDDSKWYLTLFLYILICFPLWRKTLGQSRETNLQRWIWLLYYWYTFFNARQWGCNLKRLPIPYSRFSFANRVWDRMFPFFLFLFCFTFQPFLLFLFLFMIFPCFSSLFFFSFFPHFCSILNFDRWWPYFLRQNDVSKRVPGNKG